MDHPKHSHFASLRCGHGYSLVSIIPGSSSHNGHISKWRHLCRHTNRKIQLTDRETYIHAWVWAATGREILIMSGPEDWLRGGAWCIYMYEATWEFYDSSVNSTGSLIFMVSLPLSPRWNRCILGRRAFWLTGKRSTLHWDFKGLPAPSDHISSTPVIYIQCKFSINNLCFPFLTFHYKSALSSQIQEMVFKLLSSLTAGSCDMGETGRMICKE